MKRLTQAVSLPSLFLLALALLTITVVAPWSVWQPGKAAQANPEVSVDDDPAWGPIDAPVTIVQFGDYQCPYCKQFHDETLPQISETYEGQIRFVYRDFPLAQHPDAQKAAEASECADDQERFWDYHDLLWANQLELDVDSLKAYAAQLGLDTATFDDCLDSGANAEEVQNDYDDGVSYGVPGTPTFFINGIMVVGAQPFSTFQAMIDPLLPPPVGGIAELSDVSDSSGTNYIAMAGLAAAALAAITAGASYARRRWLA
jgi:protein-disulfide isomerase